MNYIFIDLKQEIQRIGLVKENKLLEIYVDEDNKVNIGEIYRGRVQSVIKGLNSAFVDLGTDKNAYLSFKDVYLQENQDIGEVLVENKEIIVQVEKEGILDKGPKVTNKIEISGVNMVVTPYNKTIRISRKIKDRELIDNLKKIAEKINFRNFGLIFRTSAQEMNLETLENEYVGLVKEFDTIQREKNFLPCPKLIYKELRDWELMILDEYENIDKILVNERNIFEEMKQVLLEKIGDTSKLIFEDYQLEYDENVYPMINKALKRKLSLNSGASLVFDELEALTAIDVNTQAIKKDKSFRKNILKANLDSAKKIAWEIRLRNISGIILIDFINMDRQEDRERVKNTLIAELGKDRIKSFVYDYTKLGLLEMNRTKKRNSLKNTWKPLK